MLSEALKFSLPTLLSIAVSTAALIIASSIFLQCLTTKYIAVTERYRALTGEYRGGPREPRHDSVRDQIKLYKSQIHCLSRATGVLCAAILVFLVTISTASLRAMLPSSVVIKSISAASLFPGLALIGVGMCWEWWENRLARKAVLCELADFDDVPQHELSSSPG